jgi:hypothetical protein
MVVVLKENGLIRTKLFTILRSGKVALKGNGFNIED